MTKTNELKKQFGSVNVVELGKLGIHDKDMLMEIAKSITKDALFRFNPRFGNIWFPNRFDADEFLKKVGEGE